MANNSRKFDFDLVVIGSGAAGAVAAEIVAASGRRVAVVESEAFGGYTPNFGEIPRRAVLNAAHEFSRLRWSANFGLRTNAVGYNFPAIRDWKNIAIRRSGAGRTVEYLHKQNIRVVRGRAHFISRNEISLGSHHISSHKFLIATGSSLDLPNIANLENIDYLTPDKALETNRPPKTLAIIGGGATGVELAELFAIFGTKVYLLEKNSRILSNFDEMVSSEVSALLSKKHGVEIVDSAQVLSVTNDGPAVKLRYLRGEGEKILKAERILIATGSKPNTDIGLISAKVECDENGIITNDFLQTSAPNIFAAGDVISRNSLGIDVAGAIYQSQIAGYNLIHRTGRTAFAKVMPRVIWTDPMIASIGLSEQQLKRQKVKFTSSIIKNSVLTRANIENSPAGFAKVLRGPEGEIFGASIMSPSAIEELSGVALAMQNDLTSQQLLEVIQPFGSWSEALRLALLKK